MKAKNIFKNRRFGKCSTDIAYPKLGSQMIFCPLQEITFLEQHINARRVCLIRLGLHTL
jgi:hypothetical protein